MKAVRKCEKCGKVHNFAKCPKCREEVYKLDPTKPEQRCEDCGRVLHKNGEYLCDGKTDEGKCRNMIPVPYINRWPKQSFSSLGDLVIRLIGVVLVFAAFFLFVKSCKYSGKLINTLHDDLGCGGKTTVQKTISPDDQ